MKHGNTNAWCPKNSGDRYGRIRTLKNALANSVNTVSARLMDQVGPLPVISLTRKMGITSRIPPVPSIALGTPDISLFEMVGAYSTFVNKGIYVKPVIITRIEDKNSLVRNNILGDLSPICSPVVSLTVKGAPANRLCRDFCGDHNFILLQMKYLNLRKILLAIQSI